MGGLGREDEGLTFLIREVRPATRTPHSPSGMVTTASKGTVRSGSHSFPSKELREMIILPATVLSLSLTTSFGKQDVSLQLFTPFTGFFRIFRPVFLPLMMT